MKTIPTLSTRLFLLGALAIGTTAVRADFDPIPLTPDSFTHDVIVEKTAAPPLNIYVTGSMDGGTNANSWTWFERGYVRNWLTIGLPEAGSSFAAVGDGGRTFQMAGNYATNNALLIYNTGSPTGELLFNAPAAFNTLTVLSSSSGGAATVDYVVHYAGGGTQLGQLNILDWFNSTATEVGVNANGRINMDNGQIGNLNGTRPNLFYGDIVLTDSVASVTKVTFTATGGNRTAIFAISGHNGTTYVPIAVTGFNRDMIVEKTAPETGYLYNRTTVTFDGGAPNNLGNTWYEKGFAPYAPATGLPAAGSTLDVGGTNSFKMPASYTANNMLYIANFGAFISGSTLTLDTPAAFNSLSFLSSAGNGPLVANVYVYHQDGTVENPTLTIPDWFNVTPYVYTTAGRFNTENLGLNDLNSSNPRLYAPTIVLTNTTSPVSMLIFDYVSGGRGGIFAVSGQTTAGGNFAPVTVSGFNADAVVEATPPWPPDGLRSFTTATMDGGVNNTGNTWHEKGYFPNAPWSGLPAPGAIITSLDKSDHRYQLPATYTGPNAAFVDSVRSNVNLTLAQPKAYSALSFLSATANNSVTNQAIIQFADGTSETNTFVSRDWFNNTPYAFTASGRVSVNNRTVNNIGTTNPRLYEAEFALANNVSPVTNINLRFLGAVNPTTGRMVVLAVSATAGAVRPIISTQPSSVLSIEGTNAALTAIMGGGTPPITYQWYADTGAGYAQVQNSALIGGATSTSLTFSSLGWTNAGSYYMVASNVAGPSTSSIVTLTIRSGLPDVSKPGDEVAILGGTTPGGEPAANAIDNTTTKYLNRDADEVAPFEGPQGFTLKPAIGPTIVNVLRFYTANDADERDPASYVFEGSNDDGGTWTQIGAGPLAFPTARNNPALALDPIAQAVLEVRLANTADFKLYRLSFNSVRGNATTGLLQIGEVEFLGSIASIAGPPVVRTDLPARTLIYAGRTLTLKTFFGGSDPLTYAWTKGGQPLSNGGRISGATTDTLVITDVQPSDAATYQVTATNGQGSAPSTATVVTVETRPDFNGDGLGWVLNGGATITDNVLRITEALNDQARSAWFVNPLYVGSFRATFTYQNISAGGADGFTVALQNSPAGTGALGGAGGALAINGVSPSAEIMFNIYNSSGVALGTNGTRIGDYASTAPVDIRSGNPIAVEIAYASGLLTVQLTDTVSNTVFMASYQVDIPAFAGGSTAYVGITGATGGVNAEQTISNFVYTPLPTITNIRSGGQVTFSWPATIGGYKLQSRGNLTSGTWADVPVAPVVANGMNTVTVTPTGTQFYILTLQ